MKKILVFSALFILLLVGAVGAGEWRWTTKYTHYGELYEVCGIPNTATVYYNGEDFKNLKVGFAETIGIIKSKSDSNLLRVKETHYNPNGSIMYEGYLDINAGSCDCTVAREKKICGKKRKKDVDTKDSEREVIRKRIKELERKRRELQRRKDTLNRQLKAIPKVTDEDDGPTDETFKEILRKAFLRIDGFLHLEKDKNGKYQTKIIYYEVDEKTGKIKEDKKTEINIKITLRGVAYMESLKAQIKAGELELENGEKIVATTDFPHMKKAFYNHPITDRILRKLFTKD